MSLGVCRWFLGSYVEVRGPFSIALGQGFRISEPAADVASRPSCRQVPFVHHLSPVWEHPRVWFILCEAHPVVIGFGVVRCNKALLMAHRIFFWWFDRSKVSRGSSVGYRGSVSRAWSSCFIDCGVLPAIVRVAARSVVCGI